MKTVEIEIYPNKFTFVAQKNVVLVKHFTSFKDSILEKDFPNGSTIITRVPVYEGFTDIQNINIVGRKFLKDWIEVK